MKEQILEIIEMQKRLNDRINPEWMDLNLDWGIAIIAESGELLNHWEAWKWWKKSDISETDLIQSKFELVDIGHFVLSDLIANTNNVFAVESLNILFRFQKTEYSYNETIKKLKHLSMAAANGENCTIHFAGLCGAFGVSFDEFYKLFVAKNALNEFRQKNSYLRGGYIKTWEGKEDNIRLYEIIKRMEVFSRDEVLRQLQILYTGVKNAND